MNEEAKVKSFRVTDSVAEDIKRIAGEIGGNQQTAFVQMINAYEFQKSMTVPSLSSKTESIEKYQRLVSAISRMFLDLIEECQNQEATVGASYEALLKSKDARVLELEEKCREAEKSSAEAIKKAKEIQSQADEQEKSLRKEQNNLQKELEQLRMRYETDTAAYDKQLHDKELLCSSLSENCETLRKEKAVLETAASECEDVKAQLKQAFANSEAKEREIALLRQKMEVSEAENKAQLERQKVNLELGKARELLALEQQLHEEHRKEIGAYQDRYTALMERYLSLAEEAGKKAQETDAPVSETSSHKTADTAGRE